MRIGKEGEVPLIDDAAEEGDESSISSCRIQQAEPSSEQSDQRRSSLGPTIQLLLHRHQHDHHRLRYARKVAAAQPEAVELLSLLGLLLATRSRSKRGVRAA